MTEAAVFPSTIRSRDGRPGVNVHVYPSPFEYETRILRITATLVGRSIANRVVVVATAKDGLPEREHVDASREVWRVGTRIKGKRLWPKALMFVEWSARAFLGQRGEPVTMVNCHSLSALPLSVLLKWWHKALLVYEPHELETETATSTGFRRRVSKWVEAALIGQADRVIAVSDSIADCYRRDYGLKDVPTILNVPELRATDTGTPERLFRDRFAIPDDHLVFMYQGVLSESRGVHLLLDAFRSAPRDRHLVLMGFGPMEPAVRAAAGVAPNIHLHPPVVPGEVLRHTKAADVGFSLLSGDCVNHQYALPNKLFHYLHAGIPTVVSNLEQMGTLVDRYACGWRVDWDAASIATLVSTIDRRAVDARRAGTLRARQDFNWGNEATKLEAIYRGLLDAAGTEQHGR